MRTGRNQHPLLIFKAPDLSMFSIKLAIVNVLSHGKS